MLSARPLLSLTLLLSALVVCALPFSPVSAQEATLKDTIYTSPLWGYTIRWHADEWQVDNDVTSPDFNLLSLSDNHGNFMTFTGANGFNGNAKACLDDMRANAFSDPEQTVATPFTYESGDPVEWRDKEQSYVLLSTTTTDADGTENKGVLYLECQTLIPGEAVFERFYSGSADAFDQWYDNVVDIIESVHLPASAWLPEDKGDPSLVWAGYSPLLDFGRYNATFFPFDVDDPRLLIGLVDRAGDSRAITFENISAAPVTVDPMNLALVYSPLIGEGEVQIHEPSFASWEDGIADSAEGTRTLAPGERATVDVDIAPIDESTIDCNALPFLGYEYREPDGAYADFANLDVNICLTGSMDGADENGGQPSVTSSPVSG